MPDIMTFLRNGSQGPPPDGWGLPCTRPMHRAPENPVSMASTQPEIDRFVDRAVVDCRLEPMPPARPPRDSAALWNAAKAIERRLCRLGAESPVPIVTADVCRKLAEDALDAYDNALAAK